MLSVHGLVIVAEDINSINPYQYTTNIKFWVASDIGNGKTQRFQLEVSIPNSQLETIKKKIQIGKVCEIVKADIIEIPPKVEIPNRFTSNIVLKCKSENIKFLSKCIFYEDISNITKEEIK